MANERSSGTAFFSSKDEKSVLAGAHDYFVNNVLPSDIKACVRKIKAPTLYAAPMGETGGYCLVSEPLNDDTEAWVEIPDGSAVVLGENGVDMRIFSPAGRPASAMEAKIALVK